MGSIKTDMEATINVDRFWFHLLLNKSKAELTPRDVCFALKNSMVKTEQRKAVIDCGTCNEEISSR